MPNPNNPDIEVNKPFIRFKLPDGTWSADIDSNLIKIVVRGDNQTPTVLSAESAAHGAQTIEINIDPIDIMKEIENARD